MTEFTMRISYACPVALQAAGNELMAWVGGGLGNLLTFRMPKDENGDDNPWEDPDAPGEFYLLASGQRKPEWINQLTETITEETRPAWGEDLDMALAIQGQEALKLHEDQGTPDPMSVMRGARIYEEGGSIVVKIKGDVPVVVAQTSGLIVEGPFSTGGLAYWIAFTQVTPGPYFVGFNIDDDTDPDLWVPMENVSDLRIRSGQKRAIRRKAISYGWSE